MNRIFFFLLSICSAQLAMGHNEYYVTGVSGLEIATASLEIQDPEYIVAISGENEEFFDKSTSINVSLHHDETEMVIYDYNWTIKVTYDIYTTGENGSDFVENEEIWVNYSPSDLGLTYSGRSKNFYSGVHRASLNVVDVELIGISEFPEDLFLDLEFETDRFYYMEEDEETELWNEQTAQNSQMGISWSYIEGADSYDLEWLFIDHSMGADFSTVEFDFRNAVRINTKSNHYRIPYFFPEGSILLRVRPVGYFLGDDFTRPGLWSFILENGDLETYFSLASSDDYFQVNSASQAQINWEYNATFAEDGTRFESASFYDGLLRQRQSVSLMDSLSTAVIVNSVYDARGQATLQTLPYAVGNANDGISFYENQLFLGNHFNFLDFDINAIEGLEVRGLPNNVGTGNYYSESSAETADLYHSYVPSAQSDDVNLGDFNVFAFSQTQISTDGNENVKASGGVGPDHQLGTNHDTRVFYCSPYQEELDRLFGNEVGNANHYRKIITVDPNGQKTSEIIDSQGRTVVSALYGVAPTFEGTDCTNADLEPGARLMTLDTKPLYPPIEVNLSQNNEPLNNGEYHLEKFHFNPAVGTPMKLFYRLDNQAACFYCESDDCGPPESSDYCRDCLYRLTIKITNENGQYVPMNCFVPVPDPGPDPEDPILFSDLSVNDDPYAPTWIRNETGIEESLLVDGSYNGLDYLEIGNLKGTSSLIELAIELNLDEIGVYKIEKTLTLESEEIFGAEDVILDGWFNEYVMNAGNPFTQDIYGETLYDLPCLNASELTSECPDCFLDCAQQYFTKDECSGALIWIWGDVEANQYCQWSSDFQLEDLLLTNGALNTMDLSTSIYDAVFEGSVVKTQSDQSCFANAGDANFAALVKTNIIQGLQECLDACGLQDPIDFDPCALRLQILKNDMSPGGQYFDNLIQSIEPLEEELMEIDYWLVNNLGSAPSLVDGILWSYEDEFENTIQINTWQEAREHWDPLWVWDVIHMHPEYCMYLFTCHKCEQTYLALIGDGQGLQENTGCPCLEVVLDDASEMIGISGGLSSADFHMALNSALVNEYELIQNNGLTYFDDANLREKYFNPLDQLISCLDCVDWVIPEDEVLLDSYMIETMGSKTEMLKGHLLNWMSFEDIGLIDNHDPMLLITSNLSLWDLVNDTYDIANWEYLNDQNNFQMEMDNAHTAYIQAGNEGISQVTVVYEYFHMLHGEGGLFDLSNEQGRTKLDFFLSNYLFVRDYIIYHEFSEGCSGMVCTSCPHEYYPCNNADHSAMNEYGFADLGNGTGYIPRFIENTLYEMIGPPEDYDPVDGHLDGLSASYLEEMVGNELVDQAESICANMSVTFVDNFISENSEDLLSLDENELEEFRCMMIEVCSLGCSLEDDSNGSITGLTTTGTLSAGDVFWSQELIDCYSGPTNQQIDSYADVFDLFNLGSSLQFTQNDLSQFEGEYDQADCICQKFDDILADYSDYIGFSEDLSVSSGIQSVDDEFPNGLGDFIAQLIPDGEAVYDAINDEICSALKINGETEIYWDFNNNGQFDESEDFVVFSGTNDNWNLHDDVLDLFFNICAEESTIDYCFIEDVFPFLWCGEVGETDLMTVEEFELLAGEGCQNAQATVDQTYQYSDYMTQLAILQENFNNAFESTCMSDLEERETFYMEYQIDEFNYTLFYYDQADNLIKTIPPAGVHPIDVPGIDDETLEDNNIDVLDVQAHRSMPGVYDFVHTDQQVHYLETYYKYNTLNNVINDNPADARPTQFWYDPLGRVVLSQNDEQHDGFSYTLYDSNGRPYESGFAKIDENYDISNLPAISAGLVGPWDLQFYPGIKELCDASSSEYARVLDNYFLKSEVTFTIYDEVVDFDFNNPFGDIGQENVRGRVAAVYRYADAFESQALSIHDNATFFSYDELGNVKTLVQDNQSLLAMGQNYKRIYYDYDLLKGLVHSVSYQPGQWDEFNHRYYYDDNDRLTLVETSHDRRIWTKEAKYFYYAHGPLARVELGEKQVAGTDFAYTIHGWLKAMNSSNLDPSRDIGKDGVQNLENANSMFAEDAATFSLHYFENDYNPIGSVSTDQQSHFLMTRSTNSSSCSSMDVLAPDLFNGNIAMMTVDLLSNESDFALNGYAYKYDQLNRIRMMHTFTDEDDPISFSGNHWQQSALTDKYACEYHYDENGNITRLKRNGGSLLNLEMDDLTYRYGLLSSGGISGNVLWRVDDAELNSPYITDYENIDPLIANNPNSDWSAVSDADKNFQYDTKGNLVYDKKERIGRIVWTNTGKIKQVIRYFEAGDQPQDDLEFVYDAFDNRVEKIAKPKDAQGVVLPEESWISTVYVRDASGNVMSTYTKSTADGPNAGYAYRKELKHDGFPLYGSSRLGVDTKNSLSIFADFNASYQDQVVDLIIPESASITYSEFTASTFDESIIPVKSITSARSIVGFKQYEMANHLGNVLSVITDRKKPIPDPMDNLLAIGFEAIPLTVTDYYPFGMQMPGRSYTGEDYRYGYQGSEKDSELDATGNTYTTYYRALDARLGKWWSIDPITKSSESPYVSMANNPVWFNDPKGDKVRYGGIRSFFQVQISRLKSKTFNDSFKVLKKRDEIFKYKNYGKRGVPSSIEGLAGGVFRELGEKGFYYEIAYSKPKPGLEGSNEWGALFEETAHLNDFLETYDPSSPNGDNFGWITDKTTGKRQLGGKSSYALEGEAHAKIWAAENAPFLPKSVKYTSVDERSIMHVETSNTIYNDIKENLRDMTYYRKLEIVKGYYKNPSSFSALVNYSIIMKNDGSKHSGSIELDYNSPYKFR